MTTIALINPNDPDVYRKISENINILFSSNEIVNSMIDTKIEIVKDFLITMNININKIKLKNYIIKIFNLFFFNNLNSIYERYEKYVYDYITDELITNINKRLLSFYIDIDYDLKIYDVNINHYVHTFDKFYAMINVNINKNMCMLNNFYNTYLYQSGYGYNKCIELDYLMVNNSIDTLNNDYNFLNDSYKETKNLVKILTKSDENNKKIILLLKNKNEELESNIKKLSKFIIFGFGLTLGMSVALLILN